jgi:hypothetical protein
VRHSCWALFRESDNTRLSLDPFFLHRSCEELRVPGELTTVDDHRLFVFSDEESHHSISAELGDQNDIGCFARSVVARSHLAGKGLV